MNNKNQRQGRIQYKLRLFKEKAPQMARLILTLLPLSLFAACIQVSQVMDLTGLNGRHVLEYQRKDLTMARCVVPPSALIANKKNGGISPDISLRKLGLFINSTETVDPKAIKEISADFPDTEVLLFRLCEQYGNSLLTFEQYQQFQKILQVTAPSHNGPETHS